MRRLVDSYLDMFTIQDYRETRKSINEHITPLLTTEKHKADIYPHYLIFSKKKKRKEKPKYQFMLVKCNMK